MDSQRQIAIATVAVLASGVCLFFGTGLHPVWWLMWIAPIPVLVAAARLTRGWTLATAFVAWAVGGLNMWKYLHVALEIPLIRVIVFISGPGAGVRSRRAGVPAFLASLGMAGGADLPHPLGDV